MLAHWIGAYQKGDPKCSPACLTFIFCVHKVYGAQPESYPSVQCSHTFGNSATRNPLWHSDQYNGQTLATELPEAWVQTKIRPQTVGQTFKAGYLVTSWLHQHIEFQLSHRREKNYIMKRKILGDKCFMFFPPSGLNYIHPTSQIGLPLNNG